MFTYISYTLYTYKFVCAIILLWHMASSYVPTSRSIFRSIFAYLFSKCVYNHTEWNLSQCSKRTIYIFVYLSATCLLSQSRAPQPSFLRRDGHCMVYMTWPTVASPCTYTPIVFTLCYIYIGNCCLLRHCYF